MFCEWLCISLNWDSARGRQQAVITLFCRFAAASHENVIVTSGVFSETPDWEFTFSNCLLFSLILSRSLSVACSLYQTVRTSFVSFCLSFSCLTRDLKLPPKIICFALSARCHAVLIGSIYLFCEWLLECIAIFSHIPLSLSFSISPLKFKVPAATSAIITNGE